MFYKLHRIQHNTNAWHTFEPINKINKQDTEEPQRETKRKLMGILWWFVDLSVHN